MVPGVLLYPDEVAGIEEFVADYNAIIAAQIAGVGGAVVDINAIFDEISAHGFHLGGINLSTSFLSGGIFSADGVHPSSIGYTIIANAFIQTMNFELGLEIPTPDFSHVLFTPNVPETAPACAEGGVRDTASACGATCWSAPAPRADSRSRCRWRPPPGPPAAGRAASPGTDPVALRLRPSAGPGGLRPGAFSLEPWTAGFC